MTITEKQVGAAWLAWDLVKHGFEPKKTMRAALEAAERVREVPALPTRETLAALPGTQFYSTDAEYQIETHATADDARSAAESALESGREGGEWSEGTESVEWGVLVPFEEAQEFDRVEPDADSDDERAQMAANRGWSHYCSYKMVEVIAKRPPAPSPRVVTVDHKLAVALSDRIWVHAVGGQLPGSKLDGIVLEALRAVLGESFVAQSALDPIMRDFAIDGDETPYEVAERQNAALGQLAGKLAAVREQLEATQKMAAGLADHSLLEALKHELHESREALESTRKMAAGLADHTLLEALKRELHEERSLAGLARQRLSRAFNRPDHWLLVELVDAAGRGLADEHAKLVEVADKLRAAQSAASELAMLKSEHATLCEHYGQVDKERSDGWGRAHNAERKLREIASLCEGEFSVQAGVRWALENMKAPHGPWYMADALRKIGEVLKPGDVNVVVDHAANPIDAVAMLDQMQKEPSALERERDEVATHRARLERELDSVLAERDAARNTVERLSAKEAIDRQASATRFNELERRLAVCREACAAQGKPSGSPEDETLLMAAQKQLSWVRMMVEQWEHMAKKGEHQNMEDCAAAMRTIIGSRQAELTAAEKKLQALRNTATAALDVLQDTRWSPIGDMAAWAKTGDGMNHSCVMAAIESLRMAIECETAATPKAAPSPNAPTDIAALPDWWDARRLAQGKPDASRCAAELRVALASKHAPSPLDDLRARQDWLEKVVRSCADRLGADHPVGAAMRDALDGVEGGAW